MIASVIFVASVVLSTPAGADMAKDFKPTELKLSDKVSEPVRARIVTQWNGLSICLNRCLEDAVTCIEHMKDPEGSGPPSCWKQHQQCDTSCFKQFPAR
jgi:hypothetical protein